MDKDKTDGLFMFFEGACVGACIYLIYDLFISMAQKKRMDKVSEKLEIIDIVRKAVGSTQVYVYEPKKDKENAEKV